MSFLYPASAFLIYLRMRMKKAIVLSIFLLLPSLCPAGVREHILHNGLKVLITEDHKSPLAIFEIWYRVGSRDEASGKTGMSHLLEHMMFKGTPKHGPKEFSKLIQKNGGVDNAFTTSDYTAYFQILSSDRVSLAMELESDRMENLLIDEKEFLSERSVVMEERRMRYEDDPQSLLYQEVIAAAFKVHPYHWPVIGWMQDLQRIRRDDLLKYYRGYYSPDNAVIVIAGDVDPDETINMVEKYFSGIKPGQRPEGLVSEEPRQGGEKRIYLKKEAELPYMMAAYHAPGFSHPDGYGLEVLSAILSGGKSSRLYKSLVYEKRLAIDADTGYSGLSKDPFLFLVDATAAPGNDIPEVEKAVYEEMEKIKNEPPSEFELKKAKNQLEAAFIMGQDSIYSQAMLIGRYEMLGDWRLKDRYLEGIRGVKAEDVSAAASRYLTGENRTVGILIPVKREDAASKKDGVVK
jgi:zinc protease